MIILNIASPYRVFVFFITLSVVLVLAVFPKLNVQFLPDHTGRSLVVSFNLQGSPRNTEQWVTGPVENALSIIKDVENIQSISRQNAGEVSLRFKHGADMKAKRFEVAAILRRLYPELPAGTSYPAISIQQPGAPQSNRPLLIYSVNAPGNRFEIASLVERDIFPRLREIAGIREIRLSMAAMQQLAIEYDLGKCRAWGIEPTQIAAAISQHFEAVYPGSMATSNDEKLFLLITPSLSTVDQIEGIVLKGKGGGAVELRQLAHVGFEETEAQSWFRINGKTASSFAVYPQAGQNHQQLAGKVREAMDQLIHLLPSDTSVWLDFDDSEFLAIQLVKNYRRVAICVGILLVFMFIAYRSWRHVAVLVTSLVITIALSVAAIGLLGIPFHLYSLAGSAIAFGLLLDNTIVMIDYYRQHRSRTIFMALFASTLTTMAALLLVFLLPETDRINLDDFAAIISVSLAVSLLVNLFFTPACYEIFWPVIREANVPFNKEMPLVNGKVFKLYSTMLDFLAKYRGWFAGLCVLIFGIPFFLMPAYIEEKSSFADFYNKSWGNEWFVKNIRPTIEKYLGGAVYQFRFKVMEKSGYRTPEKTRLLVDIGLPFGHTPAQMNSLAMFVENAVIGLDGVEKTIAQVSSGQQATIEIYFTAAGERQGLQYAVKTQVVRKIADLGGAEWGVTGVGRGFNTAGPLDIPNFRVKITGYNFEGTELLADSLAARLIKHPRIQEVNTNESVDWAEKSSQEYVASFDLEDWTSVGISTIDVVGSLHAETQNTSINSSFVHNNSLIPVSIRSASARDYAIQQMLNQPLMVDDLRAVSLNRVSTVALQQTESSILRENRSFVRIVGFDYMGSRNFGSDFLKTILNDLKPMVPPGYTMSRTSYSWNWETAKRQYGLLAVLALAIFCICAVLFGRFKQSLYIVLIIPMSFVGLFLIFAWGGFYYDQGGYAAFVLLAGLVVNAAIFIINDYNNYRLIHPTTNPNEILVRSVLLRARTILLTTVSTMLSLVPFLLEGEQEIFWFAFAVGAIGGLIGSLLAVFMLLPVMMWNRKAAKAL